MIVAARDFPFGPNFSTFCASVFVLATVSALPPALVSAGTLDGRRSWNLDGPTPAPTKSPSDSSTDPPIWVWPLAGIACIAVIVFCFGMFNSHRRRQRFVGSGQSLDGPLNVQDDVWHIPRNRGHLLLDPADAHPLNPPDRNSIAQEGHSPTSSRWSCATTGVAAFFAPAGTRLTMSERKESFMTRAQNRESMMLKGAVRWVRAMELASGRVQWIKVDILIPAQFPSADTQRGLAWIRRVDTKGGVWMVRSDDADLADDFSQIDWREIAAHDFELKARWFRHELEQRLVPPQADGGPVKFTVQRGLELEMMQTYFSQLKPEDFKRTFRFRFDGETDFFHDAGGVAREVYNVLVDKLFSTELPGLFTFSDIDNLCYRICPTAGAPSEANLQLFRMAGQVLGKALVDGVTLNVHLSAVMYKQLLKNPLTVSDVILVDSQTYSSLSYMLDQPIEGIFFETFAVGDTPLKPGGCTINVTDANKAEYVDLKSRWLLAGEVEKQLSAFCTAFWRVVPEALLSVLDFQELELLMCGLPDIDIPDWQAHTRYGSPLSAHHTVVKWFWEIVTSFDHGERARLLQFSTGTSNVPVSGFKGLQSTRGKQCLFKLSPVDPKLYSLPRAHTCFNTIDIPLYPTCELLAKNLRLVIDMEAIGFGLDE